MNQSETNKSKEVEITKLDLLGTFDIVTKNQERIIIANVYNSNRVIGKKAESNKSQGVEQAD